MARTRSTKRPARRKKRKILNASNSDKHFLYERAVQSADVDADMIASIFRRETGRPARALKEDFCGTAWLCAEWVKRHRENTAVGVDLDANVLAWGKAKHQAKLTDAQRARVRTFKQNVLKPGGVRGAYDCVIAYNYSYFTFKDRATMLAYYRTVYRQLKADGAMFLDCFGGPAAQREETEERKERGFIYRWEQRSFNPNDFHLLSHIHFKFHDRTEMPRAFTYDWRLWSLVEVRDMLLEAGFKRVEIYWEDEDKRGNGIGTFRKRRRAPAHETWNAYISAFKR